MAPEHSKHKGVDV